MARAGAGQTSGAKRAIHTDFYQETTFHAEKTLLPYADLQRTMRSSRTTAETRGSQSATSARPTDGTSEVMTQSRSATRDARAGDG